MENEKNEKKRNSHQTTTQTQKGSERLFPSQALSKRNSDSKATKLSFKERLKKSFFSSNHHENLKLLKLNRAVSDNTTNQSSHHSSSSSHSSSSVYTKEFPSFNFSPDEISNSDFGNNSEYESEFHYLEEFRKELDREYKPAFLCEPIVALTVFNYNDISDFSFTITPIEWKAYKKWVKLIFQIPSENYYLKNENPKNISIRMRIFLHFYRLEIPISSIIENNVKTQSDWHLEGYEVMECASFIQIPLNEYYSTNWWCSTSAAPPPSCCFGFANVCHYYQTKVDSNLSNTRLKYKKIKEELRKYILEFESIASIMTSDPFTQNVYVKLLIRWAISSKSKIPHKLRINSCIVLSHLAFPVETIVGLREKILKSGVVFVILTYARRGDLSICPDIELSQIQIDHFLDSGAVGRVHLGKWKGEDVAIKMCQGGSAAFVISEFRFEVALMTMLSHPNILPCLSAKVQNPSPYFLVSPYQSKGSLRSVLLDQYEEISEQKKVWVAYCVASSVKYLHKYKIIHRDIKSCNVLVGEDWKKIYLTDFGTSRFLGKFDTSPLESYIGTNEYMAPELLHHAEDEKIGLNYDFKVDVYSFAILLFEIITRSVPFDGIKSFNIPDLVIGGERPSPPNLKNFSEYKPKELVELMKSCWAESPKKRPNFVEIKRKLRIILAKLRKFENVKNHLMNFNSQKNSSIVLSQKNSKKKCKERKNSAPITNIIGGFEEDIHKKTNYLSEQDKDTIIQPRRVNYKIKENSEKKRKELAIKNLLNKNRGRSSSYNVKFSDEINVNSSENFINNNNNNNNNNNYYNNNNNQIFSDGEEFTSKKLKKKQQQNIISSYQLDLLNNSNNLSSDFTDEFSKQVHVIEEQFKTKSEILEQDLDSDDGDDVDDDDNNSFQQPPQTMGLGFSLDF